MAMQPRISETPRRSAIPITERPVSPLADALDVAARTAGQMAQSDRTATQQVDAINHQLAVKRQQEEDNALLLQQAAKWAETESRMAVRINAARSAHGPGGAGHVKTVTDIIEEEKTAFDAGFGENERVRQRYTANVAQAAARYETEETIYASNQFANAQRENIGIFVNTTANSLRLRPDALKVEEAIGMARKILSGMSMNDDVRKVTERKIEATLLGEYIKGLSETGQFEKADKLVRSGMLNDVVDDVEPLLRFIEIERNESARAVEEQAMLQREQARETAKQIEERIDGGEIIDAPAMAAAAAQMRAAGVKESEVIAFENKTVEARVNQTYNPEADPMGTQASMAAQMLAPKVFGGQATPDEERRYKHLKNVADKRATEFGKTLKPLAAQGVQGKQSVLAQLKSVPEAQRFAAAESAADGLGRVTYYPEVTQSYILQGRAIKEARATEFEPKVNGPETVKAAFAQRADSRIAGDLGGEYKELFDLAQDIYIGTMASRGKAGWDEAAYDVAVQIAFGGNKRPGSEIMQGGIRRVRDNQVILPQWVTASEFDQWLSRLDYSKARYLNNRPASKADILAHYRPRLQQDESGDGYEIYIFLDGDNKPLLNDKKQPFRAAARK